MAVRQLFGSMLYHCPNCRTALVGEYCHGCGQRRLAGRLSVRDFVDEVARRVFRFDRAFALTFWRLLHSPGAVVVDYLEGRRQQLLDPIHFFISSVFAQFVITALTRALAPAFFRDSALTWLERLGGVVGVKILFIFWMASIWRLLFPPVRYNLAEIYVFATYVFGTTGLLWSVMPIFDLLVPWSLGVNGLVTSAATFAIEVSYASFAVAQFARLPLWRSFLRVSVVLAVGHGVLIALVGLEHTIVLLLPSMPTP